MRYTVLSFGVGIVLLLSGHSLCLAGTLDEVVKRGFLQCGVSTGLPGFSNPDEKGNWSGIDVDVCRAVASAVLGDRAKVKFTPLKAKERFAALQSGEVDILSRNTTWTLTRDTALGLNFTGVSYFDGQGFMVPAELGVSTVAELDGMSVCVQSGTTTELNLTDYFRKNGMSYTPVLFDTPGATMKGFVSGRCKVLTSDQSQLFAHRFSLAAPENVRVLPETISKEPLGPAVRQGDDAWFNVVRWSLFAMINAEELGIDSNNIDTLAESPDPAIRRFLGSEGINGEGMGLASDWAYRIVKQVGNYAEVFDRNVGQGSPLKIDRGVNALWSDGGIQYAPPVR